MIWTIIISLIAIGIYVITIAVGNWFISRWIDE